jgi:hypothetical protein
VADQLDPRPHQIKKRRPLRLAAVQLKHVANHRVLGGQRLLLKQEPLIELGRLGPDAKSTALFARDYEQLRGALRSSAKDLVEAYEKLRLQHLDKKLRQILQFCHEMDVDIVVFPECSLPASLVPTLLGFPLAVFAGTGILSALDVELLRQHRFPVERDIAGCNAAVFFAPAPREAAASTEDDQKLVVTKRNQALGEEITPGDGIAVVQVPTRAGLRTFGLAICKDYLREIEDFRGRQPPVDAVLAPTLTRDTAEFADPAPRDFIRVFANWAFDGGSTVAAPELQGMYVERDAQGRAIRTEPIPAGQEGIVIIDWDFFLSRVTPLDLPANRVARYCAVIDIDDRDENDIMIGEAVRAMARWTLADYRAGAYSQTLRSLKEVYRDRPPDIVGRAVDELVRATDDGAAVTDEEFLLLTKHVVLRGVWREEEMRYRLLEDVIERWSRDRRVLPSSDSGRFVAEAERQRRRLEGSVRLRYRSRLAASITVAGSPDRATGSVDEQGLRTFYSARLGGYEGQHAIETLPRQLDLLHTIAASASARLRLSYRVSTRTWGQDDLVPVFDVVAAAEPDAGAEDDLVHGIGEQIGAVFSSGWDISGADTEAESELPWTVQLRLSEGYVPAIKDDWASLVDYLRALPLPVRVEMTVEPAAKVAAVPANPSPEEPLGFLSPIEQSAAAFLTRAARGESATTHRLELAVYVSARDPLPVPVLQTIAQWLLGSERYEIDAAPPGRTGRYGGTSDGAAVLTPAQALRIFHPPYGAMEARGLNSTRHTDIAIPSGLLPQTGIELGRARVAYGHSDRTIPVRLSPRSRQHHVYVLGRSGSGKTNLLKNMARQDIAAGHGVAVIDPHGELVDYLVQQVSGREEEVVLLDFGNRTYLPVLNPLDLDVRDDFDRTTAVEEFIELVERQSYHEYTGPRFEDLVRLAIESVVDPGYPVEGGSVVEFPPILRSDRRRTWLRSVLSSAELRDRWDQFEGQGQNEKAEVLHWVLAKFSEMTKDNILGQVLGGGSSTVSITDAVERNAILLVKVPEWEMSRSAADFLGALIQERVRHAVYSRWRRRVGDTSVEPFHLYVDEFQAFATTRFEEMLAEARKFGLCLTLAHQNIRQMERFSRHTGVASSSLLEAVFGNVSTMVYLGGSVRDNVAMANELSLSTDQLQRLQRHTAAARVLLDDDAVTCTLQFDDAAATPGLPKPEEVVRQRMIDSGAWVQRTKLRDLVEERQRTIAQLALAPSPTGESAPDGEAEPTGPARDRAVADEPTEQNPAETPALNISWPWDEEGELANTTYVIRDGMIHIVLTPGPRGLRFVKSRVRFSVGHDYREVRFPAGSPRKRAAVDRLPLVISLPYPGESTIRRVAYVIEDEVFTLTVYAEEGGLDFARRDVRFSRGFVMGDGSDPPDA